MKFLVCALLVLFASMTHANFLNSGTSTSSSNCTQGNANQIAACLTASLAPVCSAALLNDYYAEIGNASGVLWSYTNGGSINRYTLVQLDSFTKFVDGAYWTQIRGGVNNLTADDVLNLHQQSGGVNMPSSCPTGSTVLSCLQTVPGVDNILSLGSITNGGSGYPIGTTLSGVVVHANSPTLTNTGTNNLVYGESVYLSGTIPSGFATDTPYYVTNVNGVLTATSFQLSPTSGTSGIPITPTTGTTGNSTVVTLSRKANLAGGTGTGATATLAVSGSGSVTGASILAKGSGYLVGDVLTSTIGGGSGLAIPVTDTTCYPASSWYDGSLYFAPNSYGGICNQQQGVFFYNGGNFQRQAVIDGTSGFYNLTRTGVAQSFNTVLMTPSITASTSNSTSPVFTAANTLAAGMHVYLTGSVPTNFNNFLTGATVGKVYYVVSAGLTSTTFELAACWPASTTCAATPIQAGSVNSGIIVTIMPITFSMPLLAGGGDWSAGGMAVFLTNIIEGNLQFQSALGAYEVTTNYEGNGEPSGGTYGTYCQYTVGGNTWPAQVLHGTVFGAPHAATTVMCGSSGTTLNAIGMTSWPNGPWIYQGLSQSQGSPIAANYKYGVAHWVISDPVTGGDGAYAGIGSKGVDGWVDSTTSGYYGMLVRVGAGGSGYKSNVCDNLIRYAYMTATPQLGPYPP